MKRPNWMAGLGLVAAIAAACGGGNPQRPASESAPAASTAAPAPGANAPLDITFQSEPEPPKAGENTFDVMVMQGTQPVTDADVSIAFYMPAMPSMKMAEMKNSVALKHESGGRYRGTGNVMMSGSWDATVVVTRGGQEIGSKKLTVVAK